MISLALLLIGYSVFSALFLALTHFRAGRYQEQRFSKAMGWLLLFALGMLQMLHFAWLQWDGDGVHTRLYSVLLFSVAPAFFLFSQPLLIPKTSAELHPARWWHALPVFMAAWLPWRLALPLAFLLGAVYLVWLARSLYRLRAQRAGYRVEMGLLGGVFMIAVGVALLGQFHTMLPGKLFFELEKAHDEGGPEAVKEAGTRFAIEQCAQLLAWGAPGVHLYTLNRAETCQKIITELRARKLLGAG